MTELVNGTVCKTVFAGCDPLTYLHFMNDYVNPKIRSKVGLWLVELSTHMFNKKKGMCWHGHDLVFDIGMSILNEP